MIRFALLGLLAVGRCDPPPPESTGGEALSVPDMTGFDLATCWRPCQPAGVIAARCVPGDQCVQNYCTGAPCTRNP